MRRVLFLIITVFSIAITEAQDITDGLRYTQDATTGTARFNAMSGAFGALGGDLSAMSINPAGSAIFLRNEVSVTGAVYDKQNDANYFNTVARSIETDVDFSQAGAVFVFDNSNPESPWKKFTVGVNYNVTQNFDDSKVIIGRGNTSIAEFFLAQAQGIPLDMLQLRAGESIPDLYQYLGETQGVSAQNAFLGFQGYIIDPVDPSNPAGTQYISNIAGSSFNHEYQYASAGYNGKYTLNFATQFTDEFYFGLNLNTYSIDYIQRTFLYETNSNPNSIVNEVGFENTLAVLGTGFSAQLGGIAKIADNFRLGFTYDTPTWYKISEETTQYLETVRTVKDETILEIVDPRVLNVFADYKLRTPGKVSASAAYVFGKDGLISFDYGYKDFSRIKFSSDLSGEFDAQNTVIANSLKGVSSFRVGGEYRINELSLRGGFQYEDSPFDNNNSNGELIGFSGGIGYNFGNYKFDISYSRSERTVNQQLYAVGLTDSAKIDSVYNNIIFTLGINL